MIDKLIFWLLENPTAPLTTYLLLTIVFMGMALHKRWLVLGSTYTTLEEAHDEDKKLLQDITEKLTDQRILNEGASVSIRYLTADLEAAQTAIQQLNVDLAKAEGRRTQGKRPR